MSSSPATSSALDDAADSEAAENGAAENGTAKNGTAKNNAAPRDAADLVRMINQIAANVAHHPHDRAVAQIVAHVRASWAPAMRGELDAYLDRGTPDLSPLAAAAAGELAGGRTTRSSPA